MPASRADELPLLDKVAHLRRPASYPGDVREVTAVETHMSWVFLTERHAFKLKKPVRYEFLDFSTLDARRHDCEEELRLNRRLAPDVYLGIAALRVDAGGRLQLDVDGRQAALPPVEWLVHMRRLPASRMLDESIRRGTLSPDELDAVADLLADFYSRVAAPVAFAPEEYLARLERDVADCLSALHEPRFGLDPAAVDAAGSALEHAMRGPGRTLVARRALDGRLLEGHGDLRPEHVHLGPPPAVIDCLEFNAEFRKIDPADELGFLALECERLGAAAVGERVLDRYRSRSGDPAPAALVHLYMAMRALLRAKLAVWHLRDGVRADASRWIAQGGDYLSRARAHASAVG